MPSHVVDAHRAETSRIEALQKPLQQRKKEIGRVSETARRSRRRRAAGVSAGEHGGRRKRAHTGQRLNVIQIEKTLQDDTLRAKITEKDIVALMPDEVRQQHAEVKAELTALDKQKPVPFATARAIGESGREPRPS